MNVPHRFVKRKITNENCIRNGCGSDHRTVGSLGIPPCEICGCSEVHTNHFTPIFNRRKPGPARRAEIAYLTREVA